MKIAVIGAGIFGVCASVELSKQGYEVTLFEKNKEILQGSTANSQNRLHLGLHYPRDIETAKQSIVGFHNFKSIFGEALYVNFPNYYAIPKEGSKVSPREFEFFCQKMGITIKPVQNNLELHNGVRMQEIDSLWLCEEGVIDMNVLQQILKHNLDETSVKQVFGTEVIRLIENNKSWFIEFDSGNLEAFDLVIRCTYSSDLIEVVSNNLQIYKKIFQKTVIQQLESSQNDFGITIVDGDFLTILPHGFSGKLLAYGPSISTRSSVKAFSLPTEWNALSKSEIQEFQLQIRDRIDFWLTNWNYKISNKYLETVRTIEVGVESTDRRTSHIRFSAPNLIDVWSGKIDHAIQISKDIAKIANRLS